jgi:hypothetical protein
MESSQQENVSAPTIAVKLTLESSGNFEIHRFEITPDLAGLTSEIEKVCICST